MTGSAITAPPRSGKTLGAVDRIRDHLLRGRRVATNLNLNLDKMLPAGNRTASVVRLPDRPSVADLDALGLGWHIKGDEENYGLIVLDECATWLNTREWNQPGRRELFNWFVHHGKCRWHVMFILQDIDSLDSQCRKSLIEYHVQVMRLDKQKLPVISALGTLLSLGVWNGYLPKIHRAVSRYIVGNPAHPPVNEQWFFRGVDLFDAYDTEQKITDDYPHGVFTYLPPWHLVGWNAPPSPWQRFLAWLRGDLPKRPATRPAARLAPLMRLDADLRWLAARQLVLRGVL